MMAGLVIENAKPFVLDSSNNHAIGPRGLFSIVVDEFDGENILSWHIEDTYGEISRNLGASNCKSLDAIVGRVSMFTFQDAIGQLRWTSPRQVNMLIQENENLKKELAKR
jgi:hypothetical protein